MIKIFYTEKKNFPDSEAFIRKVFKDRYKIEDFAISRTVEGKPFATETELFFSVSHTKTAYFLAVSEKNVGIDAEEEDRSVDYAAVAKTKFPHSEQAEIRSLHTFLTHWTAKEAAVKWLGGTISRDLKKLCFTNGVMRYDGVFLPFDTKFQTFENHVFAVCGENLSEEIEVVKI